MRIIVMFDLPTITDDDKKISTRFRNFLLDDGYTMIQYSVYSRICKNNDDFLKHSNRLKIHVPESGNIRMIQVTESQYENMLVFYSNKTRDEEIGTESLIVF